MLISGNWQGSFLKQKPVEWPKDSQKYDIYTNKEGMYELEINNQKQKHLESIAAMFCFLMFGSSLVISYMRWKLKILQDVSRPLSL